MRCPNCTTIMREDTTLAPAWEIVELGGDMDGMEDIQKFNGDFIYSMWMCAHCHCIVLRCEE